MNIVNFVSGGGGNRTRVR